MTTSGRILKLSCRAACIDVQARVLIDQALAQRAGSRSVSPRASSTRRRRWDLLRQLRGDSDIDHFMERSYLNALGDAARAAERSSGPI